MKLFNKYKENKKKYISFLGLKLCYGKVYDLEELNSQVAKLNKNVNTLINELKLRDIYTLASVEHRKVFPKYKNCNLGKDMVLVASGPTLDYYNLKLNALYIGVNKSFYANKADLDYLFVQDYDETFQKGIDDYKGNNCQKFYGTHYLVSAINEKHLNYANAEKYYFIDCNENSTWDYPPDISVLPFKTYSSVVHPAVIFALWTGVKRIFLVGCDTSGNQHATSVEDNDPTKILYVDNIKLGWIKLKKYVENFYSDVEIISINPVGLKGLFRDVYTKNYVDMHPELVKEVVEIINVEGEICLSR